MTEGHFNHTSIPVRPPQNLLTAVSKLQAHHALESSQVPNIISEMLRRHPKMACYARPDLEDRLFCDSFSHQQPTGSCDSCDKSNLILRAPRMNGDPVIHYGRIASGNQVLKDGKVRAELARKLGVLCFEMEAAGLMDQFPCLVIRGICDYSDSHKNKKWQEYAAAVAAAYTKELLLLTSVISHEIASLHQSRKALLNSLAFEQVETRRANIRVAHKKTCEWILEHSKYLEWSDDTRSSEHSGLLWIGGKPGAGKSTLMKYLYTQACGEDEATANPAVISFFFNARGVGLEKSIAGMFRSLLLQVLQRFPDLEEVLDRVKISKQATTRPSWNIEELQTLFLEALKKLGQRSLVCFVDALDECDEAEIQEVVDYFETLGELVAVKGLRLRICSSSRHYPYLYVSKGIKLILEEQHGHKDDMTSYVWSKLRAGKGKAAEEIVKDLLSKASGVFMWIVLAVDILNKEFQRGRLFAVKKRLLELPAKLGDMFSDIISRNGENMEDFILSIQWILYAKRPLTYREFYLALVTGLDPTPDNLEAWDSERITKDDVERFVLGASKGLAEIAWAQGEIVQFIHESVRDFFLKDNGIEKIWPDRHVDFESVSQDRLKQCCEAYLQVDTSAMRSSDDAKLGKYTKEAEMLFNRVIDEFPFLDYATMYLFEHAVAAAKHLPQDEFLKSFDRRAWIELNNLCELGGFGRHHYASETCLTLILIEQQAGKLIESAIHHDADSLIKSEQGVLAFFLAAERNYTQVIKTLFETCGAFLYGNEVFNKEILGFAASEGRRNTVELLLGFESIEINAQDEDGRTALLSAARNGHVGVMEILISTNRMDVNLKDKYGCTALMWATKFLHYEVVKLLLRTKGVDILAEDNLGKSALIHAAEANSKDIQQLLRAAL
jgi:hypothetical protein